MRVSFPLVPIRVVQFFLLVASWGGSTNNNIIIMNTMAFSTTTSSNNDQQRPSQYFPDFFQSLPTMEGKIVVITGCSRGLGYVTALTVARKGGSVIMLNRPSPKSQESFQTLQDELATSKSSSSQQQQQQQQHYLIDCDLLSFESVREACHTVQELTQTTGIHILCNNAGIMLQPDRSSKDGYDITSSTNMLSHFLITKELFPMLQQGAYQSQQPSRVITMSSASGYGGPPLDIRYFEPRGGNLGGTQGSYQRYHQSKLANLAFTAALHDKLQQQLQQQQSSDNNDTQQQQQHRPIIQAIACTPGVCGTDMFVHATSVMNGGKPASKSMVPSIEDGAMAQIKCIFDPEVQSGELWGPGRNGVLEKTSMRPPQILVDETSKIQIWDACEAATGGSFILYKNDDDVADT